MRVETSVDRGETVGHPNPPAPAGLHALFGVGVMGTAGSLRSLSVPTSSQDVEPARQRAARRPRRVRVGARSRGRGGAPFALTSGEGVMESSFDHYEPVRGPAPTRPRTDDNPLNREEYLHRVTRRGVRDRDERQASE